MEKSRLDEGYEHNKTIKKQTNNEGPGRDRTNRGWEKAKGKRQRMSVKEMAKKAKKGGWRRRSDVGLHDSLT